MTKKYKGNIIEDIYSIVSKYNNIKEQYDFKKNNSDLISDIFLNQFLILKDRYNSDDYFFSLDEDFNISLFQTTFGNDKWGNNIIINEENKETIIDIIENKGFTINTEALSLGKDYYFNVLKKIKSTLNYFIRNGELIEIEGLKSEEYNPNDIGDKKHIRETLRLAFGDYIAKFKLYNDEKNVSPELIISYLDELNIDKVNNNIKTLLLNNIFALIDLNSKENFIVEETMKIYHDADIKDIAVDEKDIKFDKDEILLSFLKINDNSRILSEDKYNNYDILTFPIYETLFDKKNVLPYFHKLEENKSVFTNKETTLSFLPFIQLKSDEYGIIGFLDDDGTQNIKLYRKSIYTDGIDLISKELNMNENIISLIKKIINFHINENIKGNIYNLGTNGKTIIKEFIS